MMHRRHFLLLACCLLIVGCKSNSQSDGDATAADLSGPAMTMQYSILNFHPPGPSAPPLPDANVSAKSSTTQSTTQSATINTTPNNAVAATQNSTNTVTPPPATTPPNTNTSSPTTSPSTSPPAPLALNISNRPTAPAGNISNAPISLPQTSSAPQKSAVASTNSVGLPLMDSDTKTTQKTGGNSSIQLPVSDTASRAPTATSLVITTPDAPQSNRSENKITAQSLHLPLEKSTLVPSPSAGKDEKSLSLANLPASKNPAIPAPSSSPSVAHLWGLLGADPSSSATKPLLQPQSRDEVLTMLHRSPATHVALWSLTHRRGISLPREEAIGQIQRAEDSRFLVMPLQASDAAKWQQIIDETTATPSVTHWLTSSNDTLLQERIAQRNLELENERISREKLGQTFYQFLLGQQKTSSPTPPATQSTP